MEFRRLGVQVILGIGDLISAILSSPVLRFLFRVIKPKFARTITFYTSLKLECEVTSSTHSVAHWYHAGRLEFSDS